jgi:DNA-damage-inducible protein J
VLSAGVAESLTEKVDPSGRMAATVIHVHYNSGGATMPANALVQTRIDPVVKERAAEVLEELGLTVSEAVRILLTRTANEGAPPFLMTPDPAVHDAWFRAKVRQALADPRPGIPHAKVEARFAKRRAAALRKAK